MHYKLTCVLIRLITAFFGRIEIKGHEKLPPKGVPFLYAANHTSHLDPPIMAITCPYELSFLAKEELFENKIFGFAIHSLGAIPLDRKTGDVGALRQALRILKKNKPLVLFPQGTRGKSLDDYGNGVGFLCKKAKVPVFVARIYGAETVFPKGSRFFHFGKIRVIIDQVADIKEEDTYDQIADKVMNRIKNL